MSTAEFPASLDAAKTWTGAGIEVQVRPEDEAAKRTIAGRRMKWLRN